MRARILEQAVRLFGEKGFDGTSIQAIADAVGIRKPSLLYHFASKETLRDAVLLEFLGHWKSRLPGLLAATPVDGDRFSSIVRTLIDFFMQDENRARMCIRELVDRPEAVAGLMRDHLSPWLGLIAEYIRLAQRSGLVKKSVAPEAYIIHVLIMVMGTVALGPLASSIMGGESGMAPDQRMEELVRIARDALYAPRTSSTGLEHSVGQTPRNRT